MARALMIIGLVVAAIPFIAYGVMMMMGPMPGCQAGSAPTSGCVLFGLNVNWLVSTLIVLMLSFFITIPAGFLLFILGVVVALLNRRKAR